MCVRIYWYIHFLYVHICLMLYESYSLIYIFDTFRWPQNCWRSFFGLWVRSGLAANAAMQAFGPLWEANATSNMCWGWQCEAALNPALAFPPYQGSWLKLLQFGVEIHSMFGTTCWASSRCCRVDNCIRSVFFLTQVGIVVRYDSLQVIWIWDAKFWYFLSGEAIWSSCWPYQHPTQQLLRFDAFCCFRNEAMKHSTEGTKDVEASDDPEKGVTTCHLTCHHLGGKCLGSKMHIQHPYIWRGEPKVV